MAPWLSSALVSPMVGGSVLLLVVLLSLIARTVARRAFEKFTLGRLMAGYAATIALLAFASPLIASFSIRESILVFVLLSYFACLSLSVLIVPAILAVLARGECTFTIALLISAVSGLPIALAMYWLAGGSESQDAHLIGQFFRLEVLLTLIGSGFALGARLPLRRRG